MGVPFLALFDVSMNQSSMCIKKLRAAAYYSSIYFYNYLAFNYLFIYEFIDIFCNKVLNSSFSDFFLFVFVFYPCLM